MAIQKSKRGFGFAAINKLLVRVNEAKAQWGSSLYHMLVLPPGESLKLHSIGGTAITMMGSRPKLTITSFGRQHVAIQLPPSAVWPAQPPARAVVAERGVYPARAWRAASQKPYRVHLFFGQSEVLPFIESLAAEIIGLSNELSDEIFPSFQIRGRVLFHARDDLHGRSATVVDAWMCTIHWWSWRATDLGTRAFPRIVFHETGIDVDPLDQSFSDRLSYSLLDTDVLTATEAVMRLLLRFYDLQPHLDWYSPYPPPRDESDVSDTTTEADSGPAEGKNLEPTDPIPGNDAELASHIREAWNAYEKAEAALLTLNVKRLRDEDIYKWLENNPLPDYELPAYESWSRYVREYRGHHGLQKNLPRAGREGRSIRKPEELN